MNLYDFQENDANSILRHFLNGTNLMLAVWATGAGKSTLAKLVTDRVLKDKSYGIDKAVVVCPFHTISKGFSNLDSKDRVIVETLYPPQSPILSKAPYIIDTKFELVKKDTGESLKDYIEGNPDDPKIFTHSTLSTKSFKSVLESISTLKNCLFVIDECQHLSDDPKDITRLGKIVQSIIALGGKVLLLSATPYRTTQNNKVTSIMESFKGIKYGVVCRTMGEQMEAGLAPSLTLSYQKININVRSNHRSDGVGDRKDSKISKKDIPEFIKHFKEDWSADGYPKSIITIPAGNSVKTAHAVQKQLKKIVFPDHISARRGGRTNPVIINAVTGLSLKAKEHLLQELDADKKANGQQCDLVLACRKFDEGSDCPSASHMYCIGAPSNVRLFHQRVGRTLRSKLVVNGYIDWFGSKWLNVSKVTFYIPSNFNVNNLDDQVANQVLNCVFASQLYNDYCKFASFGSKIKKVLRSKLEKAISENGINSTEVALIEDFMSKFSEIEGDSIAKDPQILRNILAEMRTDKNITAEGLVNTLSSNFPESELECIVKVISLLDGFENNTEVAEAMIETMIADIAKANKAPKNTNGNKNLTLNPNLPIKNAMKKVWMGLVQKFKNEKMKDQTMIQKTENNVDKILVDLTGKDYRRWANECQVGISNQQEAEKAIQDIKNWKDANGKYPDNNSANDAEADLGRKLQNIKTGVSNSGVKDLISEIGLDADEEEEDDFEDEDEQD